MIVIEAPLGSLMGSVTTTDTQVTLAGSGENVASISVTTAGGTSVAATGTSTWTAANVPLTPGENILTVVGVGGNGLQTTQPLDVIQNPIAVQPLQETPTGILVGGATPVTFTINFANDPSLDSTNVDLLQVDASLKLQQDLGALSDAGVSGNLHQFSGQFAISSAQPTTLLFRVSATAGGKPVLSDIVTLQVSQPVTAAELTAVDNALTQASQAAGAAQQVHLRRPDRSQSSSTDPASAALAALQANSDVQSAVLSSDGDDITVLFNNGLLGLVDLAPPDTYGGGPGPRGPHERLRQGGAPVGVRTSHVLPVGNKARTTIQLPNGPAPDSNKVAIIDAAANLNPPTNTPQSDIDDIVNALQPATQQCPGLTVQTISGGDAGVDFFRTQLNSFGALQFCAHGGKVDILKLQDQLLANQVNTNFIFKGTFTTGITNQVCIQTGTLLPDLISEATVAALPAQLQSDLRSGKVGLVAIGDNEGNVVHNNVAFVTPQFIIDNYNSHPFPSSLIVSGSCFGAFNISMASAFLNCNCQAMLGWTSPVRILFADAASAQLFSTLAQGESVATALTVVKNANLNVDPGPSPTPTPKPDATPQPKATFLPVGNASFVNLNAGLVLTTSANGGQRPKLTASNCNGFVFPTNNTGCFKGLPTTAITQSPGSTFALNFQAQGGSGNCFPCGACGNGGCSVSLLNGFGVITAADGVPQPANTTSVNLAGDNDPNFFCCVLVPHSVTIALTTPGCPTSVADPNSPTGIDITGGPWIVVSDGGESDIPVVVSCGP